MYCSSYLLALVIFGPAKLPQLAHQLGKYRAQLQQMQRELMKHVEAEMSNITPTREFEDKAEQTGPLSSNITLESCTRQKTYACFGSTSTRHSITAGLITSTALRELRRPTC